MSYDLTKHNIKITEPMNKSILLIGMAFFFLIFTGEAQCGWVNGMDDSQTNDPGRGIQEWQTHYDNIMLYKGLKNAHSFVGDRFTTLKYCLSKEKYADLYADVSIVIAGYGSQYARWIDGQDPNYEYDPGRGIKTRSIHYDHVIVNGTENIEMYIMNRMVTLVNFLPIETYAKLYADVSVIIAKYGE
jgi:hypothetical protein